MIKAIIFDLDNCLVPGDAVGADLYAPALEAIRQANRGHYSDSALESIFADIWKYPLDHVAERHAFPEAIRAAAWDVFRAMEVTRPLTGYDDLPLLAELPVQRFLVTTGFRRLQESKIAALRIAPYFLSVHVDAIDEPGHPGKEGLFRQILAAHALAPAEVLVAGDNPDSEIAAGNRLGIPTVQTLRPGVLRSDAATHHVHSLSGVQDLLTRLSGKRG